MESVVIVAPGNYDEPIGLRLARTWQVSRSQATWVIQDAAGRAYVTRNDLVRNELEPEDLRAIAEAIADPTFYTVDFSDIDLCRRILLSIADDPMILVDNDHGVRLSGSDFVRVLRSRPDWDWRRDPV